MAAPVQLDRRARLSRATTDATIRERLGEWPAADYQRREITTLAADVIERCHALNPDGWTASYIVDSRFDQRFPKHHRRRLVLSLGLGSVLVVHARAHVFLAAPPAAVDPDAAALAASFEGRKGVRVSWSDEQDVDADPDAPDRHQFVECSFNALDDALEDGLAGVIDPFLAWRAAPGRSPRWKEHSAAVVRVLAAEVGRELPQPDYEAGATSELGLQPQP